jgi:hypothetical protein
MWTRASRATANQNDFLSLARPIAGMPRSQRKDDAGNTRSNSPNSCSLALLLSAERLQPHSSRYDKLARNFLAAVQRAAIVAYWIDRIWTLAQVGVVAKSPRKEIREDYQRPSALGHGVLASA